MTAHIICDNDATLHVVIGNDKDPSKDEAYSNKIMKKFKNHERKRCNENYGTKKGPEEFSRHYFHIHRVTCEEAP